MYNVTLLEAVPARTRWPFPRVLEETYPRFRSFRLFVIYFVGLFEDLKVFGSFFFFFFFTMSRDVRRLDSIFVRFSLL